MHQQPTAFENIVGKEIAGNEKFLLFPQCFLLNKKIEETLRNRWSDFEIISQERSYMTLFKNCSRNSDPSINMALVNRGFLHHKDMKKFFKRLL